MFRLAYPACVALGAVLLQTSPPRGISGNKMESFLRGMREVRLSLPSPSIHSYTFLPLLMNRLAVLTIFHKYQIERHPQVLHLPPPHIWQLTPAEHDSLTHTHGSGFSQSLVVTLELRVAKELDDREVVKLTRWAWERCVLALGMSPENGRDGERMGVTVGVVSA